MEDFVLKSFLEKIRFLKEKIDIIYLFGSRARGTARPDSDYDLLLVVSDTFTMKDKDLLYDAVMDVLLEKGRLVSLKIFTENRFKDLCQKKTPFTRHVLEEGLKIG